MEEQNDFTNTGKVPYNKTLAGKSSGKSCLLAMLISAAVIAAIVIVVLLIFKPSCFQTGDRIKGSISVTLDGEPVNIESISFTGEGVGTPKIEYDNGSAAFSILGNRGEEMYCIICEIDDLPTIKIGYYHYDSDDEFVADYVIDLHKEDDGNIFYAVHSSVKYDLNGGEYIVKDSTGKTEDGIIWIDAG